MSLKCIKKCLVLLSTYNGEKYLQALIDSVLSQQEVEVSILIRDDCSNDKTAEILERLSFENKRIKFYSGQNVRPAKSFMDLISEAEMNYDYYAFCDQDDVWLPNKLKIAIEKLDDVDSSIPLLYSSAVTITDKELNTIGKYSKDNSFQNGLYDIVMYATMGCTMVFNTKMLYILKQYHPAIIKMHDSWISYLCYAVGGRLIYDDDSYILYRQHEGNVVGAVRKSYFSTIKKLVSHDQIYVSEMCKDLLKGYSEMMTEKARLEFEIVANYKKSLRMRLKLFLIPYNKNPRFGSRNQFCKMKIRLLVGTL